MNETRSLEILEVIKYLLSEKVSEVKDFAIFLRERYGRNEAIDESDKWTDEDLRIVSNASPDYADEVSE